MLSRRVVGNQFADYDCFCEALSIADSLVGLFFQMRRRISLRGSVRPFVGLSGRNAFSQMTASRILYRVSGQLLQIPACFKNSDLESIFFLQNEALHCCCVYTKCPFFFTINFIFQMRSRISIRGSVCRSVRRSSRRSVRWSVRNPFFGMRKNASFRL